MSEALVAAVARPPTWNRAAFSRRSFPVAQVNDRIVQIVSGPGLDFTLAMPGAAANMHVRTAGRRASFKVAAGGSRVATPFTW